MGSSRTKECLPGCVEKCYSERRDALHFTTLRNAVFLRKAIVIREAIMYGRGHPLLESTDVMQLIERLVVECLVYERLEKCVALKKPWTVGRPFADQETYTVSPPESCVYRRHATSFQVIRNCGRLFTVPGYFWYDDVYHSIVCNCSTSMKRLLHEKKQREGSFSSLILQ
jgi:hypothetical protein